MPECLSDIRFLMLLLTSECNLRCAYCYTRAVGSGEKMTWEMAKQAVDSFAAHNQPIVIEITGGEPLLNFSVVEKVVPYARQLNPRTSFSLQTNGTLLDEEKIARLVKLGVGIAISMDGVPDVHDAQRGGSKKIVRALTLLEKYKVGVNLTAVLTRESIDRIPEFILFCGNFPAVRVVNLDLLRPFDGNSNLSAQPPTLAQVSALAERLPDVVKFTNQRRFPPLKVRELEQIRKKRKADQVQAYCHAALCQAVAVTPQGALYPCASLAGIEAYQAGSLDQPALDHLAGLALDQHVPQECLDCELVQLCRGGCPSRRAAYENSVKAPSNLACHFTKALYQRMENSWNQ